MASRYLEWLNRDVQPEEPVQMTRKQRWQNWWDYHFWYVVTAAALVLAGGYLLWNALGIGKTLPDYQIAYVGSRRLGEEAAAAVEAALAGLGEDLDGDGQVTVALRQYIVTPIQGQDIASAYTAYAVMSSILADIDGCESEIFLLEDPALFQESYQVLSLLDGSLPPEGDWSAEGTYLPAGACPALAPLEEVGDLFLARRGYGGQKTAAYPEGQRRLWSALTGY